MWRVRSHQRQKHGQDVLVDQVLGIVDQDVAIIRLQGGAVSRAKSLYLHAVSRTRTEQPNTEQQQMNAASTSARGVRGQETPHTASCDGSAQTPSARGPLSRDDSVCLWMRHSARTRGQNRCPVVPPPGSCASLPPHPALTSGEPPPGAASFRFSASIIGQTRHRQPVAPVTVCNVNVSMRSTPHLRPTCEGLVVCW